MTEQFTNHPFTDSGFENMDNAVEVFGLLNIDGATLRTVDTLKLKNIADFVNSYENSVDVMSNVLRKRQNADISPIDYINGYIELRKRLNGLNKQIDTIKEEINFYE